MYDCRAVLHEVSGEWIVRLTDAWTWPSPTVHGYPMTTKMFSCWMVAIESTRRMMGRVIDPPQHAAAAFSHHQLIYEEGTFEWSKGMLPPMARYAAAIETWEAF